ncbi:ATP-binding protein [Herbidospora galbida]|uniref:ATP-binding protein n=1 Tax=Herbidospora galbida TaxID=2575442 RepID=A0A4U3MG86_9ACTN|nr:ATP-binding protein [Herbidospora galbida]TKK87800.1 ATP-binding protein [Herbidospora galbida]
MPRANFERWAISDDYNTLRGRVMRGARLAGLSDERVEDLALAVHEAVVNVVEHGGGRGELTMWQDGTDLVIEVSDEKGELTTAHVRAEPPPPPSKGGGRGLWLIHQICDEVVISRRAGRSTVRMRARTRVV